MNHETVAFKSSFLFYSNHSNTYYMLLIMVLITAIAKLLKSQL